MPDNYTNIYKLARKSTLYSREDAAEFLHISDRSLAAYESGERIPPIDVVNRMTRLYHRPDLAGACPVVRCRFYLLLHLAA